MTAYLVNTKTGRKFEIVSFDDAKNMLTLRGESGGKFETTCDKPRFKELGYRLEKTANEA